MALSTGYIPVSETNEEIDSSFGFLQTKRLADSQAKQGLFLARLYTVLELMQDQVNDCGSTEVAETVSQDGCLRLMDGESFRAWTIPVANIARACRLMLYGSVLLILYLRYRQCEELHSFNLDKGDITLADT